MLDDEQLVNTLHSSKITAAEVAEQLTISEQTEIKIDAAREVGTWLLNNAIAFILYNLNSWNLYTDTSDPCITTS